MNSQTIATIREALIVRFNDLDDIIRHGVYAEPVGIQETLVAIDAALAELAALEQQREWEPVPKSLEYDLVTHAIQHGALTGEYRICRLTTAQEQAPARPDA